MTRKEILFRENITLWNEYNTLTGAATTDLDEYAQTYKYQKALKESRAFDLESANESLRQKIEKAKAEKERAAKVEAFYQTPEGIRLLSELDAQELAAIVEFKETDEAMRRELQDYIHRTLGEYWMLETSARPVSASQSGSRAQRRRRSSARPSRSSTSATAGSPARIASR